MSKKKKKWLVIRTAFMVLVHQCEHLVRPVVIVHRVHRWIFIISFLLC